MTESERPLAPVGAVLVAAGDGVRFGADAGDARPKALVELGGVPLVAHAAARLLEAGVTHLVVVHHPAHGPAFRVALAPVVEGTASDVRLVTGGAMRTDSVRLGVEALPVGVAVVAVHDAARPLTPATVIAAAVTAVLDADGVVGAAPAMPVADTLRRVADDGTTETVARDGVVTVQTPQVFPRAVLAAVLDGASAATDDLALVEAALGAGRLTGRVVLVDGSPLAHKVTYRRDLELLERLARGDTVELGGGVGSA